MEKKKSTRFGQLIKGTEYASYSIDNEFFSDDNTFIEEYKGRMKLVSCVRIDKKEVGFWQTIEGKLYVCDKINYDCPCCIAYDKEDVNERFNLGMKKGFTLVELLIVIIIVGILATVGFTQYTDVVERSRGAEAKNVLGQLRSLCLGFYMGKDANDCTAANLGIGTGTDLVPSACRSSHFFSYGVATTTSTATFTATRCTSSGKTPNHNTAHTVTLAVDFAAGTDTYTSAAGY